MDLDDRAQDKLFYLFRRMGDFGRISDKTKFNHEGDQIYAFKPQPNRFLCFFQKGKKIIVTSAFHKKTQKLPRDEKDRAVNCREDYNKRLEKGDYYHDNQN
jgi:phage-related protein